jgi:oxygen-independent coproporphyrinogen-3 oxidase
MEQVQTLRASLAENIASGAVYGAIGYVYGYPHKKAYRPLARPRPLADVWAGEPRHALFCYVHVPFCTQRCSFCNLFTFVPAGRSPAGVYLDALAREMEAYARVLAPARFRRLYVGGGTPTYLDAGELLRLTGLLKNVLGVDPAETLGCIEASPETLDEGKVGLLRELGFRRLSLGIQSLVPGELRQVNRHPEAALNRRAIDLVGRAGFPHFNIDLIYGLPGQTEASWRYSLEAVLDSPATSLFLYPLYVRPLTGLERYLSRAGRSPTGYPRDHPALGQAGVAPGPTPQRMAAFYDLAVERLAAAGFRQLTMRQFRRDPGARGGADEDLEYRCQRDGMVGLGAGARSYTAGLHYSAPWKMVARNIRGVVEAYCAAMAGGDTAVRHGFELDDDERQRRFVILSLLFDGLDFRDFTAAFGADARLRFAAQWEALTSEGCVTLGEAAARLTPLGVRHADVVGQLFFSERVRRLVDAYEYDA